MTLQRYEWEDALIKAQAVGAIGNGELLTGLKLASAITWNKHETPELRWANDLAARTVGMSRSVLHDWLPDLKDKGFFMESRGNLVPLLPDDHNANIEAYNLRAAELKEQYDKDEEAKKVKEAERVAKRDARRAAKAAEVALKRSQSGFRTPKSGTRTTESGTRTTESGTRYPYTVDASTVDTSPVDSFTVDADDKPNTNNLPEADEAFSNPVQDTPAFSNPVGTTPASNAYTVDVPKSGIRIGTIEVAV